MECLLALHGDDLSTGDNYLRDGTRLRITCRDGCGKRAFLDPYESHATIGKTLNLVGLTPHCQKFARVLLQPGLHLETGILA